VDFSCICQNHPERTHEKAFRKLWTIKDVDGSVLLAREPPGDDEHVTVGTRIIENSDNLQSERGPM
jgi:hypothetical protein